MNNSVYTVIDLKSFYSYVECVDRNLNPYETPLVVADKSRSKNTIILSVTPYLKNKGIPSRLRIKDLPPGENYIYATPRMERYLEMSNNVFSIILNFISEEDLHIYSIDECFINLTPYLNYYKLNPYDLVKKIKCEIKTLTGLETTIGMGENMFLAKLSLDNFAKHREDGIFFLKKEDVFKNDFNIFPLNKIWGIGDKIMAKLNYFGIYSYKDMLKANKNFLMNQFGIIGEELYQHINGIDDTNIREKYIPVSTSLTNGQTLFFDYDYMQTKLIIRELCDDLTQRMRLMNKTCGCVSLYIGYSKNGSFFRQLSLLRQFDSSFELYSALLQIYEKFIDKEKKIRKVSITFSKLKQYNSYFQIDLFEDYKKQEKLKLLENTIDNIQSRFGNNSIMRATALLEHSTIIERHGFIGGHKR